MGTLQVEVFQREKTWRAPRRKFEARDVQEVGIVSEKALKGQALSHSVGKWRLTLVELALR